MKIMHIAQGSVYDPFGENEVALLVICFIYFKEQTQGGTWRHGKTDEWVISARDAVFSVIRRLEMDLSSEDLKAGAELTDCSCLQVNFSQQSPFTRWAEVTAGEAWESGGVTGVNRTAAGFSWRAAPATTWLYFNIFYRECTCSAFFSLP